MAEFSPRADAPALLLGQCCFDTFDLPRGPGPGRSFVIGFVLRKVGFVERAEASPKDVELFVDRHLAELALGNRILETDEAAPEVEVGGQFPIGGFVHSRR